MGGELNYLPPHDMSLNILTRFVRKDNERMLMRHPMTMIELIMPEGEIPTRFICV